MIWGGLGHKMALRKFMCNPLAWAGWRTRLHWAVALVRCLDDGEFAYRWRWFALRRCADVAAERLWAWGAVVVVLAMPLEGLGSDGVSRRFEYATLV